MPRRRVDLPPHLLTAAARIDRIACLLAGSLLLLGHLLLMPRRRVDLPPDIAAGAAKIFRVSVRLTGDRLRRRHRLGMSERRKHRRIGVAAYRAAIAGGAVLYAGGLCAAGRHIVMSLGGERLHIFFAAVGALLNDRAVGGAGRRRHGHGAVMSGVHRQLGDPHLIFKGREHKAHIPTGGAVFQRIQVAQRPLHARPALGPVVFHHQIGIAVQRGGIVAHIHFAGVQVGALPVPLQLILQHLLGGGDRADQIADLPGGDVGGAADDQGADGLHAAHIVVQLDPPSPFRIRIGIEHRPGEVRIGVDPTACHI